MSIEIVTRFKDKNGKEIEHGDHFSSAHGLKLIGDWSETLDKEDYPDLMKFFEDGYINGSLGLVKEIKKVIKESPPDDSEVMNILRNVSKYLMKGHPEETVSLEQ